MGGADLTGEGTGLEDPPPGDEPLGADGLPEGEPEPVIVPEESVAAMHEGEDLGFGEIVKLMRIAEGICAETGENSSFALDSLLAEYDHGIGMGKLFKKYGKQEHLGVGQIRKELDPQGKEKTNNGKAKGKDK